MSFRLDDKYTKVLLHMNGTDGSTTFLDESGKTWTPAGNAQIDTAQSKFGGASGIFDGTGDWINASDHADFDIGTGNFTFDFWAKANSEAASYDLFEIGNWSNNRGVLLEHATSGGGTFSLYFNGGAAIITATGQIVGTSSFAHFAIVRNGTAVNLYKNGTSIGSATSSANIVTQEGMRVGGAIYSGVGFNGWLDEFRYSLGIARWTGNFTSPIRPYFPAQPIQIN